jgi:hypothetical protein
MKFIFARLIILILSAGFNLSAYAADKPHNIILFVPDGLRALMVRDDTAPTMVSLRDAGVTFINSHSLFPTFTMPNASAMATGHYLGDTGVFSNYVYDGYPVPGAGGSMTPFLESDPVLGDIDDHFAGDYIDIDTILKVAREAGFNTATVGKLGPTLIFDHTERSGQKTVIVDDATGQIGGIPLAKWLADDLMSAGIPLKAPTRGPNGKPGNATTPGTLTANVTQQQYFTDLFIKFILPKFKKDDKPFVAVFWSRDPDGTQHNQGDSFLKYVPGINGPTSLAAIKNADNDLRQIQEAIKALGLEDTTDIIVSADHGFSTISKQSDTSPAAKTHYTDVPEGFLPPGFVAKDLQAALDLSLWDPDQHNASLAPDAHSKFANGLLGDVVQDPSVVVAGNGGSDLIYLPQIGDKDKLHELADKIITVLLNQDYTSGIFVDDRLGRFPGTLSLSDINLQGSAITPMPAIVVNFKSFTTGCDLPTNCTVEVADTALQQGQGMHGSFSRADTFNFTAAYGPDFKKHFIDTAPVSNADIGKTIAAILKLTVPGHGTLWGRVLTESMPDGTIPQVTKATMRSKPAANGMYTVLNYQQVDKTLYFDAAGFPGRTVGLNDDPPSTSH